MGKHPTTTWFNYVPLRPIAKELIDDGSRVFCSIPISREAKGFAPLELAFIGDATKIDLIRVGTPNTDGDLTPEERQIVGHVMDHAISVLRLVYDVTIDRAYLAGRPVAFGQFSNDEGKPQLHLRAEEFSNPLSFHPDQIRDAITATAPVRLHVSLLAEAAHPMTPLSFKYLCYYKILELELRVDQKWRGLDEHLRNYEGQFQELNISKAALSNFLHAYRDKCAHIKTGRRDERGLTGMGSKDGEIVIKFLPLLNQIVIDLINKNHGHLVKLQPVALPAVDAATDVR